MNIGLLLMRLILMMIGGSVLKNFQKPCRLYNDGGSREIPRNCSRRLIPMGKG